MSNQTQAHVADDTTIACSSCGLTMSQSRTLATIPAGADVTVEIPTWRDRMPEPRQQKYCTMNCGGGARPCEDCGTETVYGDPLVARDAEIADLRARIAAGAPAETPKPFAGPGAWFSVDILGNPMREYALGKWENCTWPSAQPAPAPATDARDALDAARYHWLRDPSGQKAAWQLEAMDKKIDAAMLSANSPREAL